MNPAHHDRYAALAVHGCNLIGAPGRGGEGGDAHQVGRLVGERLPIFVHQFELPTGRRQGGRSGTIPRPIGGNREPLLTVSPVRAGLTGLIRISLRFIFIAS